MFALITILGLLPAFAGYFEESRYECVIIGTTPEKQKAVQFAKQAALKLKCPLDEESLKTPHRASVHAGLKVSIYFSADNDYAAYLPGDSTYVVTVYAGDASGLRAAVKGARKHFKDAMISIRNAMKGRANA